MTTPLKDRTAKETYQLVRLAAKYGKRVRNIGEIHNMTPPQRAKTYHFFDQMLFGTLKLDRNKIIDINVFIE